jgi:hypothetical protein
MLQQTTTSAKLFIREPAQEPVARAVRSRPDFDDRTLPLSRDVTVRQPTECELQALWQAASAAMGMPLANPEVIRRIVSHDRETIWICERNGDLTGAVAFIYLTPRGVSALRAGEFNPFDPQEQLLARHSERPAGCYFWMAFKLRRGGRGMTNIYEVMRQERFRETDFWAKPYTEEGRRTISSIGLRPFPEPQCPGLYRYVRKANRPEAQGR